MGMQHCHYADTTEAHTFRFTRKGAAPNGDAAVAEGGDLDVDVHPERPHEAPDGPHEAKHGHIPHVVEHARAVRGQAVRVETKVPVAPEVRAQHVVRVLLRQAAAWANLRRMQGDGVTHCGTLSAVLQTAAGRANCRACKLRRPHAGDMAKKASACKTRVSATPGMKVISESFTAL
jgi:hypothetical protein